MRVVMRDIGRIAEQDLYAGVCRQRIKPVALEELNVVNMQRGSIVNGDIQRLV